MNAYKRFPSRSLSGCPSRFRSGRDSARQSGFNLRARCAAGVAVSTLVAAVTLASAPAHAQAWPSKGIRLVVPYAPGGATDIIGRSVATELSGILGQPVTVDNRPGAGGNLGAEMVANAPADGYTMLVTASSLHGITPFLYSKLRYDPNKDLAPAIVLASFANVLVVNKDVKANTVPELIAAIKAQPDKFAFASSGSGSTIHMSGEMFKMQANLPSLVHVPYKGSAPAITDLIGGQVQLMFDNIPSAIGHVRAGSIKAIATTGATRSRAFPDLPTMKEAGLPDYKASAWFGIVLPAATPKEIVARVNEAAQQAVKSPAFVKRITELGYDIVGGSAADMAAMIQDEVKTWGPVVKASGAKAD